MTAISPDVLTSSHQHAVELIKAGFAQCRYIVSDGQPAICCGAPTDGGSWCSSHRHIVYEPARPRSRPDRSAA